MAGTIAFITFLPIGVIALVWLLLYWRFRSQMTHLRESISQTNETLLAGPESSYYLRSINGIISLKTYGVLALTDHRIIFRKPIGGDIVIPLSSVTEVSENERFQGNYRAGQTFLVLTLSTGDQIGLIMKDRSTWRRLIASHIK